MTVIATVGLPGSGKSEAARVASEMGVPVVTMGDVIRQETAARDLDPQSDHGAIAIALREEEGPAAIAKRSLPLITDYLEKHDVVFVDGIRSDSEVDRYQKEFGEDFLLLHVKANEELRSHRLSVRDRDRPDSEGGEAIEDRDQRELGFGMGAAMEQADLVIENTGSLESFRRKIRDILESELDTP